MGLKTLGDEPTIIAAPTDIEYVTIPTDTTLAPAPEVTPQGIISTGIELVKQGAIAQANTSIAPVTSTPTSTMSPIVKYALIGTGTLAVIWLLWKLTHKEMVYENPIQKSIYKEWVKAGFTDPKEIKKWKAKGFTLAEAIKWSRAGWLVDELKGKKKSGIIYLATQSDYDNMPKDFTGKIKIRSNETIKIGGNSEVYTYGNSKVEAHENSKVYAYDNSKVNAHNNSKVNAHNNSEVEAYDNSEVKTNDNSELIDYRTGSRRKEYK